MAVEYLKKKVFQQQILICQIGWFLQLSETFHLSKPNIIPHIQFNVNLQNSAANLSSPLQSNSTTVLHETTKIRKVEVGKEFKKKDEFRSPNKVFNKKVNPDFIQINRIERSLVLKIKYNAHIYAHMYIYIYLYILNTGIICVYIIV